ncbi:UvrD-helicase domain-containing protein (plasmid) [Leptospira sp. WS39.C2]
MDHPLSKQKQFIEASAGTGKTHLIMKMLGDVMTHDVTNKIKENRLLNFLILTFTEKAAGELKTRLKFKILELYDQGKNPEYYHYLRDLDQITISTIHGFCNMILSEYPVETQSNPNVRLISNEELVKRKFYDLKRKEWGRRDKDTLANDILISNLFKKEDLIIYTTNKLLADTKNYEFPKFLSIHECLESAINLELETQIIEICDTLAGPIGDSIFKQGNKSTIQKWMDNWFELRSFAMAIQNRDIKTLTDQIKKISKLSRSIDKEEGSGFQYFLLLGKTVAKNLNEETKSFQSKLNRTVSFLNETFPLNQLDFKGSIFLQDTVGMLLSETKSIFEESEFLTYDQMILKVYDCIVRNPNQTLIQSIKERFNVCILDEFQDTDKNQYQIFKTLFLEQNSSSRMLFCIGDPKQSIYGFRGADIGIYLEASKDFEGSKSTLETNYRSTKELIAGLNFLFYDDTKEFGATHFFPIEEPGSKKENYLYKIVSAPDPADIKYKYSDPNESAIHIFNFEERFSNLNKTKNIWAETIKNEILNIKNTTTTIPYHKKGEPNLLQIKLKDIAILCGNKKETELVEANLTKAGIPCSIYKQRGIYQSREADQIENLLECLLSTNSSQSYKRILFSDIFCIQPNDINKFDEHSIDSYEKSLIDKWQRLIRDNRFATFFRSVMDETKLFWKEGANTLEWERKRTNIRQIFQKLIEVQMETNCNLEELLSSLRQLKQKKHSPEEEPLFDRETEADAVQILTIHASKGLEWPVVFLFYFGSRSPNLTNYEFPIEINKNAVIDRKWILSLWNANSDKEDESKHFLNEQKRLLYVALTRPNLRLYLPKIIWGTTKKEDSIPNTGYSKILYPELLRIQNKTSENIDFKNYFVFRSPNDFKSNENFNKESEAKVSDQKTPSPILYPSEIKIGRVLLQHSYTSLQSNEKNLQIVQNGQEKEIEETQEIVADINLQQLPSSAMVGNFLHNILELSDFSIYELSLEELIKNKAWKWAYENSFSRYPIDTSNLEINTESTVATLLKSAMMATLILADGNELKLSELKEEEKSSELKFHLLLQKLLLESGATLTEGFEHYLKGAIDLVFIKNNKFYIVDYKSNLLPNHDYSKSAVEHAVREKGYLFQKSVYSFILFEYLKSLFGAEVALQKFGGVFYLFLRGMNGKNQTGIYSDLKLSENDWTLQDFESIKKEVMVYIRNASDHLEKVYS